MPIQVDASSKSSLVCAILVYTIVRLGTNKSKEPQEPKAKVPDYWNQLRPAPAAEVRKIVRLGFSMPVSSHPIRPRRRERT